MKKLLLGLLFAKLFASQLGNIISLKRFKDDVREVTNNHECGLVMDFPEVQEGDVIVAYQQIEEKATL